MLPGSAEVRAAMNGLWLVIFQDKENPRDPMDYFQSDTDAFFRSFTVFFFALPIYIGMAHVQWTIAFAHDITQATSSTYTIAQVFSEAMNFLLFPALVLLVARPLKISNRFTPYIIVINWSSLALALFFAPLYILYLIGLLGPIDLVIWSFFFQIAGLWFLWRLSTIALRCDWFTAVELVVLILATGFCVNWLADALFSLSA
ncbi:MAG: hypothetical protein KUG59_04925 [Parvibaculaceae bacterium]|nr:hypothetical protein [Parvibaculaceae bacterium]